MDCWPEIPRYAHFGIEQRFTDPRLITERGRGDVDREVRMAEYRAVFLHKWGPGGHGWDEPTHAEALAQAREK